MRRIIPVYTLHLQKTCVTLDIKINVLKLFSASVNNKPLSLFCNLFLLWYFLEIKENPQIKLQSLYVFLPKVVFCFKNVN